MCSLARAHRTGSRRVMTPRAVPYAVQDVSFPDAAHSFGVGRSKSVQPSAMVAGDNGNVVPLRPVYGPVE